MKDKIRKITAFIAVFTILIVFYGTVLAEEIPSPGKDYYYDSAGVISENTEKKINEVNSELKEKTGAQIVIAAVKNTEGYPSADDYAVEFFEKWQIGDKEKDNGVLILVSVEEKEVRIEVGYGLESQITDGKAGNIIRNDMIPYFKEGNYDKGILSGFESAVKEVEKAEGISLNSDSESSGITKDMLVKTGTIGLLGAIVLAVLFLIFKVLKSKKEEYETDNLYRKIEDARRRAANDRDYYSPEKFAEKNQDMSSDEREALEKKRLAEREALYRKREMERKEAEKISKINKMRESEEPDNGYKENHEEYRKPCPKSESSRSFLDDWEDSSDDYEGGGGSSGGGGAKGNW